MYQQAHSVSYGTRVTNPRLVRNVETPAAVLEHPAGTGSVRYHRTMLMLAIAGLKPCETTNESNSNNSGCSLCPNPADGYHASFDGSLCTRCATTRSVDEDTGEGHNV